MSALLSNSLRMLNHSSAVKGPTTTPGKYDAKFVTDNSFPCLVVIVPR